MSHWETSGKSNEWYTPARIFAALGCTFDLDVAHPAPPMSTHVPAVRSLHANSLSCSWRGFVWMNPPFEGRNGLVPWLDKFFDHGNGIALTPDRSSAPWWQVAATRADAVLFVAGKIRFLRPDGSEGRSPSCGTTLFAAGPHAVWALERATDSGLGFLAVKAP